jgi:hypothetical protein
VVVLDIAGLVYACVVLKLIHMDFGGLPPIPTGSFWQFSSLAVFP